ncbi:MAG TPA: isoleucine--tRNA ligase [Candidatus Saccharibacteria bacterium]|nr:isoleucine--tRNA ligase [Candidatus Saccharibacteria bacterium]
MKFESGSRRKAIEYEKDIVTYWKQNKIFEKSVEMRSEQNKYVFYDGPPFITGVPHHGTLLSSVVKDVVPRFWTMQGKRVERVWGWDCHGLPAEVFTEKKLDIKDKRDIGTKISLEEYITTCRDNMVQTGNLWEDTIDRIGRWVNFRGAYKTMDKEYMESVWWAFKTLYEKGKIYEGEKVLMYCTRDATPLSKAEIAMDNSYQDDTDPSVFVKFKLLDESDRYLVAWTTTPWTLPSNSAIAVNKSIKYVEITYKNQILIMAKNLYKKVMTDEKHQPLEYTLGRELDGSELVGLQYEQPFGLELDHKNAFRVWHADFVTDEDGTGIAHESPAYGEDDYVLAKQHDIPWVMSTDENGIYTLGEWIGSNVWDVNKQVAKELLARDIAIKIDYIKHSYPHCFRCNTKLMYRAVPSWFMDIDGQRSQMLEQNRNIHWHPDHIKHGRFEKTIESAPDWNLSRDRFWATAMPVWKGTDESGKEHIKVIGSYAELKELSGIELEDYHRPWIDDVTFTINNVTYKRIEKVMDCWFESGSMPFAQFHFPFENVETFEKNYPADFIVEYIAQARAWFYYMHVVSVGLFDTSSFKNVIATGTMAGNDGRKMSKSFGNYTDPNEVMDTYSADALRFLFVSSSLMNGEDFSLIDKDVADISRKLAMVWNVYDFFTMYADVDAWEWDGSIDDPLRDCPNVLDQWIISKTHTMINVVEKSMKEYELQMASRQILPFIDDLSNWFVRRSRKRFWKSDDDKDKQNAYRTLHYVLVQLAHVLAPFTPFLAEELYQKLTGGESVHLRDWPEVGHVNELVVAAMDSVRSVVNEGLALRSQHGIKIRQPLAKLTVRSSADLGPEKQAYLDIMCEELNVKEVEWLEGDAYELVLDTNLTDDLRHEGVARELVRAVQQARKDAGLQVDDRIKLSIESTDELIVDSLRSFSEYITSETLATSLEPLGESATFVTEKKLEGCMVKVSLSRV